MKKPKPPEERRENRATAMERDITLHTVLAQGVWIGC
jgi:hypothetical protein